MINDILMGLATAATAFAAVMLVASALHKLIQPERLHTATQALTGLSPRAAWAVLGLAGLIELIAGGGMLWPRWRALACFVTALLWASYLGAMLRAMLRGAALDCGCSFGAGRSRVVFAHVQRNLMLFAVALFATLLCAPPAKPPSFTVQDLLIAVALFTLYVASDEIAAIKPGNRRPWAT